MISHLLNKPTLYQKLVPATFKQRQDVTAMQGTLLTAPNSKPKTTNCGKSANLSRVDHDKRKLLNKLYPHITELDRRWLKKRRQKDLEDTFQLCLYMGIIYWTAHKSAITSHQAHELSDNLVMYPFWILLPPKANMIRLPSAAEALSKGFLRCPAAYLQRKCISEVPPPDGRYNHTETDPIYLL